MASKWKFYNILFILCLNNFFEWFFLNINLLVHAFQYKSKDVTHTLSSRYKIQILALVKTRTSFLYINDCSESAYSFCRRSSWLYQLFPSGWLVKMERFNLLQTLIAFTFA